jgi:uncharacterized protein YrrD
MQLRQGATLISADGQSIGRIDRVVLDPKTKEITHLIVHKGVLLTKDTVVPVSLIARSHGDRIELITNAKDLEELPEFEEHVYVPVNPDELPPNDDLNFVAPPNFYWYPSAMGTPVYPPPTFAVGRQAVETKRNIPEETVALKIGAHVFGSDGKHVGDVEHIIAESQPAQSARVTHFVISQGLLLKERKVVPVAWVSTATDEDVHLRLSSRQVEDLPTFEAAGR